MSEGEAQQQQSPPPSISRQHANRSSEIKSLAIALSKAQAMIQHASKDSTNPHFDKSYADLASVWDACREPLTSNGISVVQLPETFRAESGLLVRVTTILLHSSGEWFESILVMPVSNPGGPQQIGSTITYGRRYSLSSMVGVAPDDDDDDDGNAGQGKSDTGKNRGNDRPAPKPSPKSNQKNPLKEVKDQKAAAVENPGEYIATFGKFKGMKLKDCDGGEVNAYVNVIHNEALQKGAQLKGQVLTFIEAAGAYLTSIGFSEDGDSAGDAKAEAFASSPEPSFDEPWPENK